MMPTVSIHQPIRPNILLAHFSVFAIHFITSFLWVSSIVALPMENCFILSALVSWLTLRSQVTVAMLLIMAAVFVRYSIWDASNSWFALSQVAVTTCLLLASRSRFCEIVQRFRSVLDSYRPADRSILLTIRNEGLALILWLLLAISYCTLASVLILQTVGSQEEWLTWAQKKRVVLWPHPTLIILGLFAFLCFKRWQWSTTITDQCRLLLRREAIQILDPDLGMVAQRRSSTPQHTKDPASPDKR